MRSFILARICLASIAVLVVCTTTIYAKIYVNLQVEYYDENGEMLEPYMAGIEQWDAKTGQRVLRYDVDMSYGGAPETVDAITMGPDGYLYALGHSMINMEVLRLDPSTGLTTSIHSSYFSGGGDIDFDTNGDLIASGDNFAPGTPVEGYAGMIRRFDGHTGVLKDGFELELNNEKVITWIALNPNGLNMFALGNWGASRHLTEYSYSSEINSFQEHETHVLDNSYNDIWIGPDGLIYLRGYHHGGIDRYTQSGVYFDRFTEMYFSDLTWIEGKLLAVVARKRVAEIDPITGSIVRVLIDASSHAGPESLYFGGMAAFSVVPEPSTACLMLGLILMANAQRLSRKQR